MDRGALLECYLAGVRFKPDLPLNRWLGDRMAMIAPADALYVYARSGIYAGSPLRAEGETRVRFRIAGERAHYMIFKPADDPRAVSWSATDVRFIDTKEEDYEAFPAAPAPARAEEMLREVLAAMVKSAREMSARPPEERDPHLAGIVEAGRREARALIEEFRQKGI